jgi:hypothetical protein
MRISPILISAITAVPQGVAQGAADAAGFEKEYPDTEKIVLDNSRVKSLGLNLGKLKNITDGWAYLSEAIYGDRKYGEYLKRMNGGEDCPLDVLNFTQSIFCGLSDRYCAPVIKIRTRPLVNSVPKPVEPPAPQPKPAVSNPPVISNPPTIKRDAGVGSNVSVDSAKKITCSLSRKSSQAGTEGDLVITVAGDIPKGEPSVDISGENVKTSGIQVSSDGHKFKFHIFIEQEAEPGTRYITLSVDGNQIGKGMPFTIEKNTE